MSQPPRTRILAALRDAHGLGFMLIVALGIWAMLLVTPN
jgi:hypothetical protein